MDLALCRLLCIHGGLPELAIPQRICQSSAIPSQGPAPGRGDGLFPSGTHANLRWRNEDSMRLVERSWQNPPAARSNLLERVAKAYPPPPKPAPSPFE